MASRRNAATIQGKPVRHITDFFKPFTVPKSRVPVNNVVEDEIIVASPSPRRSPERPVADQRKNVSQGKRRSPAKVAKRSRTSSVSSIPSKGTPRGSPLKHPLASSLAGAADDDELVHTSPASSQQRFMTAVEVPSPKLPPPPTPTPARQVPPQITTTSFSSISTLSSVPLSSQSSSRRVMKAGLQAVTNSDSGSVDDSSDELADIDAFLPRKKVKMTPSSGSKVDTIEAPSTVKPARQSARLSDKSSRRDRGRSRPPTPPRTVYKHSLQSMIKQKEKMEKQEAQIALMEAQMQELKRKRAQSGTEATVNGTTVVAAAAADDSDEGERMRMAIERTEALMEEKSFSLFSNGAIRAENRKIPVVDRLDTRWARTFKDERARTQACLTGFAEELAKMGRMTQDMITWFAFQLVHEPREDLCEAYVEIIRACAEHIPDKIDNRIAQLSTYYGLVTRPDGDEGLETSPSTSLSDSDEDMHAGGPSNDGSVMRNDNRKNASSTPRGLKHVVNLIASCAQLSGIEGLTNALFELALANVDEHVICDAALRLRIQDAIEALAQSISAVGLHEAQQRIADSLFDEASLPRVVQAQLIAALPASSPASHALRRVLALRRLTEGEFTQEHTPPNSEKWTRRLLSALKSSPEFAVSDATDYNLLAALADVLDIAIDAGFHADFAFLNETAKQPTGPFGRPPAPSEAEQAFNADIDALTNQLRLMTSRIKDAGATHLRRTEAKSALERVVVRLEHTVRTRPKPRKGVFGGGFVGGDQKGLLDGFMKMANVVDGGDEPPTAMSKGQLPQELPGPVDASGAADERLIEPQQPCVAA